MVDWQSLEVQAFCLFVFNQMTVFVLGAYLWYLILSLHSVELKLVTRRIRFSWTFIPYLLGRWSHVVTLLMLVIILRLNIAVEECRDGPIMRALAILANLALVSASTNLLIRAVRLWCHDRVVIVILMLLAFIHWGLCIGVGISGFQPQWDPIHMVCIVNFETARKGLFGFYLYTIIWDLLILVVTVTALYRVQNARPYRLWSVLLTQGVAYLLVTCLTNIPMTIMIWLNLNYTMSIFFIIPGNTVSVIASSALVTSLMKIKEDDGKSPRRSRRFTDTSSSNCNSGNTLASGILTTNIDLGLTQFCSHETTFISISTEASNV